jgi:diadenosine tetraphosphate (Ap4A) HIT family hydrolase
MNDSLVFESEHFTAEQARSYRLPGYLIVESKAEVDRLDVLSRDSAQDLAMCLAEAERIVRELVSPERIYTLRFGEVNPRIHFHVIPRSTRVAAAYAAEVEDAPPYNGARLVDWLWTHHANLGFTDEELRSFVAAARACSGVR